MAHVALLEEDDSQRAGTIWMHQTAVNTHRLVIAIRDRIHCVMCFRALPKSLLHATPAADDVLPRTLPFHAANAYASSADER